jgi:nucleotidyltransferase/DNA polymerase involved in DNA repair
MHRYVECSRQVFAILIEFTPKVEPISIDEAFLDITGCIRLLGSPEEIAQKIKRCINERLNLTASVGIAPNKFIAKIASDLEKPDGLVIVEPDKIIEFLHPLPISKMWGVGKKSEVKLQAMGIHTIGDLAKLTQDAVIKKFGKNGLHFWMLANGMDEREVEHDHTVKSVSLENTYEEDVADEKTIEETIFSIADNVSRILRDKKLKGKTVTLKIRLADFSTFTRAHSYGSFFDSLQIISETSLKLYHNFNKEGKKVRLLGIAVSNLDNQSQEQLGLFDRGEQPVEKIDKVIDLVQHKFGPDLIKKASLMDKHSRRIGTADHEK